MDLVDTVVANFGQELPHIDPLLLEAVSRIIATAKMFETSAAETLKHYGLAYTDFDVLGMLRSSGPPYELSPTDLLGFTLVTSGSMTACLDRLECAKLITRRVDEADRRARIIGLTDQGRALIDAALIKRYDAAKALLSNLKIDDAQTLNALLKTLSDGRSTAP